jgi:hypothetical protein
LGAGNEHIFKGSLKEKGKKKKNGNSGKQKKKKKSRRKSCKKIFRVATFSNGRSGAGNKQFF